MHNIIVTGIGTGVGKTVVSAVLTTMFNGDYWKPIECGEKDSDTQIMRQLLDTTQCFVHPPTFSLKASLSPHHAARIENIVIDPERIIIPSSKRTLVIETAGGIFVPLSQGVLNLDLFKPWKARWVIVSRHYLGSINHTLLTVEVLKNRKIPLLGLIFNGEPNPDTEEVILQLTQLPLIGRLLPEQTITPNIIQQYSKQWVPRCLQILPS